MNKYCTLLNYPDGDIPVLLFRIGGAQAGGRFKSSRRLRWPIGRNERRKMFDGWVATRKQLIANTREVLLENGTMIVVDNFDMVSDERTRDGIQEMKKKVYPILFKSEWDTKINAMRQNGQAFDKYGQEIH